MKGKKRIIAVITMVILTFSALSLCANASEDAAVEEESSAEGEALLDSVEKPALKVACVMPNMTTRIHQEMIAYAESFCDDFNVEFQLYDCTDSIDKQLDLINSAITWGADGIMTFFAPSNCYRVIKACQDAGVYVSGFYSNLETIQDVKEEVEKYEYYCGTICEDEYNAGRDMANDMIDQGGKKIGIVTYQAGQSTQHDARVRGVEDVVEERADEGVEIVAVARSADTDMSATLQSVVSMGDEVDAIIMTGLGVDFGGQIIINSGRAGELLFATVDIGDKTAEMLDQNVLQSVLGGHYSGIGFSFVLLYHGLLGTPLRTKEGLAPQIVEPYMIINNTDDFAAYEEYNNMQTDEYVYTPEELAHMIKAFNPEVDNAADFQAIVDTLSLDDVVQRHSK